MSGLFGSKDLHTVEPQVIGINLQSSCYGGGQPIVYGTNRISGNLLDYDDFTAIPHTTSQSVGKGGGGTMVTTSWTYTAGVLVALAAGPITSINRVWADKELGDLGRYGFLLFPGDIPQTTWGYWAARHPAKATSYAGLAYVCNPAADLGGSGALKNFSFEVRGFLGTVPDTALATIIGIGTGDGFTARWPMFDPYGVALTSPWQCAGMEVFQAGVYVPTTGYRLANGWTETHVVHHSGGHNGDPWDEVVTETHDREHLYITFKAVPAPGASLAWLRSSWSPMDAKPEQVVRDFLSSATHGALWDPAKVGDLVTGPASYAIYCQALGFAFSPVIKERKAAADHLQDLLDATNSEAVWSAGPAGMLLKVVPYGDQAVTANGASYVPATTQLYDLDYDDFLGVVNPDGSVTGEDPITANRTSPSEVYNCVPVDFNDRANSYNTSTLDDPEPTDVAQNGLKKAPTLALPCITRGTHAKLISRIRGQRNVYVRTRYAFRLGWKYLLLEPMDLVTLTDPKLQLACQSVRLVSVDIPGEDGEEEGMEIAAEEWPFGTGHALPGTVPDPSTNWLPNTACPAGDTNAPTIVSLPPEFGQSGGPEIAIGASGGPLWGGCEVWISTNDATYELAGILRKTATHGFLTAAMETTGTARVDVSSCDRQLLSVTEDQAQDLKTATYCDTEVFAWRDATLLGAGVYELSGLVRGAYGTGALTHVQYSPFLLLDDAPLYLPITPARLNKVLYLKLPSFNTWGRAVQSLADLDPVVYVPGSLLSAQRVTNLATAYLGQQQHLVWDRIPLTGIVYEVRLGATWASAQVLAVVSDPSCPVQGNGTYWVAGLLGGVYSEPADLEISGAILVKNVVQTWVEDFQEGTFTGGAVRNAEGALRLTGGILFDDLVGLFDDLVGNFDDLSGSAPTGSYEVPASHVVDLGTAQQCTVTSSSQFSAANPTTASARIFIALAGNDGIFGDWQAFVNGGDVVARKLKMKVELAHTDFAENPAGSPLFSDWSWTVDMPDRMESITRVTTPAAGNHTWTFSRPFQVEPNIQVTLLDGQPDDILVLDQAGTDATKAVFRITNGGATVSRLVNVFAQGY